MTLAGCSSGAGFPAAAISTVVAPASSYALIDKATLKSDLNITSSTDDLFLTRLIARASRLVVNYCDGNPFVIETISDTFFPARDLNPRVAFAGAQTLRLKRWPVQASPAITVSRNGVALVQDVDFTLDAEKGLLLRLDSRGYPTRWDGAEIVAQYAAGYSPIPDDVIDIVETIVKARYAARSRDPAMKSQTLTGVYQRQFWGDQNGAVAALTAEMKDTLEARYRVPVLA